MGAWGTGPFDSDGALDYLGDLEEISGAARNGADEVDSATVNRAAVLEQLRRTLAGAGEQDLLYAAAGLVAARLVGQPSRNTGTRLFDRIFVGQGFPQELGLDRHCGYLGLIDRSTAEQLQGDAMKAVAALRGDEPWLGTWNSPAAIVTQLERLALELAPGRHAPRESDREPELGP